MARPKKNPDAPVTQEGEQQPAPTTAKASAPAFVFIGDKHGHGPDILTAFGLTFKKNGDAVEVENVAVAKRLAGNGHFQAV